mmetsp:Transcript_89498/g.278522  ORF Transcript_89498/g.278522 Transcript_89498/m.278522 type:complete len:99 (-) Transcript_89498:111-407(-)
MACHRRGSRALCGLVLLGALAAAWLAAPCFVQPPVQAPQPRAPSSSPAASALGVAAASWLAASQPAFADGPQYPGLPYVVVFVGAFSLLFIIPNTIFK